MSLQKKVINLDHDGDRKVACAWDDCDLDGYDCNKVRVNYGTVAAPQMVNYVFCTEKHRQYWLNSTRSYGNAPEGWRRSIL
jgi:hypothetical protein